MLNPNAQETVLTEAETAVSVSDSVANPQVAERRLPKLSAFGKGVTWIQKGGLALLDQGLVSGSNFIISILLARWLTPEFYGSYAVAFAIYVLLMLIYGALVLEPMAVFGGSAYRSCQRGYCGSLLWIHLVLSLVICLLVGSTAAVTHALGWNGGLPGALLGVGFASPFLLLLWFARRAFYLEMSPAQAATGSFLYCVFLLAGLFLLHRYTWPSPFRVFLLMGVGALLADVVLLIRLRSELPTGERAPGMTETVRRHWRYGRWALASCVASWTPTYIFYPLLSTFSGMAQSGELRALMNFFSPLDQTLSALSLLFLPYAARIRADQGSKGLRALTRNLMILSIAGAVTYWALVLGFRTPIFHALYSGKYTNVAHLLPVLALGSVFWSAGYGPAIALRAIESPASIFLAYLATSLISVIVGIPATRAFGLKGAVWASNATEVASLLMLLYLTRGKLASAEKPA